MKIDWGIITETVALLVLGSIAIIAMYKLGAGGKEIPLAIGSGIGGYLVKGAVSTMKSNKEEDE